MIFFQILHSMFTRKPVLPDGFIVEDVDRDAHSAFISSYSVKEKKIFWTVLIIWLLGCFSIFSWIFSGLNSIEEGWFTSAFIVGLGLPIGLVTWVYRKFTQLFENLFFQQFAKNHNLTYSKSENLHDSECALFNIGHSPYFSNVFTGELHNVPLKLFNYIYTVGSGKHKQYKYFTVIRVTYNFKLPPVLLVVDNQYFGGIKAQFKNSVKIKTDVRLDNNFDLFTKEQYEIETLQIFTPEFISKMLENWPDCNLEFIGNKVYIYIPKYLKNKAKIEKLFLLGDFITDKLSKTLKTISGSVKALNDLERR